MLPDQTLSVSSSGGQELLGPLDRPNIVCVLGMHRSGTSLLTRILNLMGVSLGPEDTLGNPRDGNPTGHWELDEFMVLNDAILTAFGGRWDSPPIFPSGWESDPSLEAVKQRAQTFIQDTFGKTEMWGWKDPRNCLTLPFWQQLLPNMRYILCLRNPVDVAQSLADRDNFPTEKSSSLWLRYVSSALAHSKGQPRLIIFYEDLMDNWLIELRRLAAFLGKPERAEQVELQRAVRKFIDEGLQHHRTSIISTVAEPGVAGRAKALFIAQRVTENFGRRRLITGRIRRDRTLSDR